MIKIDPVLLSFVIGMVFVAGMVAGVAIEKHQTKVKTEVQSHKIVTHTHQEYNVGTLPDSCYE